MADKIELAKAYVQVVPSAKGIGGELDKEMGDAGKKAGEKGGKEAGSAFGDFFAKGVKAIGTIAVGAATTAAAAIASITKSAVENYAEYEQLAGGIETLFEDLSGDVTQNANNAFKTAGLSANEYMETVMSFSASLNQALMKSDKNIARSAEMADKAVIDMADNANKMGTSMESIQNAYAGFAKGNYTMLDNLKLGYGGTQEEMLRLINDSGVLNEKLESLKGVGFDTIINAIHQVQTNLGITGTTAKEASSTIQGSISSMTASWNNLLTAMADPEQDIRPLITSFVDSIMTVGENIIPIIAGTLPNVISGINTLVGLLIPELPGIIEQTIPAFSDGIILLTNTLVRVLPRLVQFLVDAFPMEQLMTIISNIITAIGQTLPTLLQAGVELATTLVDNIGTVFTEMLPVIGQAGIDLVMTLVDYAVENAPTFIPELINIILDAAARLTDAESLSKFLDVALTLINALVQGLVGAIPILCEAIPQIITDFCNFLASDGFDDFMNTAGEIIITLGNGLIEAIPILLKNIPKILEAMLHAFANIFEGMLDVGDMIVQGLWQGISRAADWIKNLIKGWVGNVLGFIRKLFSIDSPSKKMAYMGKMLDYGLAEGIEDNMRPIRDAMRGVADMTTGTLRSEVAVRSSNLTGTGGTSMETLIGAVQDLGRRMEGMQVVLDSGVMIGTVDMGVGRNTALAERGVAYA